jgi:hypothetical protein
MARLYRIALLGNPGSGKTSIGDALIDLAGGERLSFAREVKREAALAVLGVERRVIDQDGEAEIMARMEDPATKDEYRALLQMWGTNFRRAQDPDYWVNQVAKHIVADSGNQVIDDCRFPNEYTLLEGRGFSFVRLEDGPTTRPMTPEQAAHESEQYWRDFPVDLTLTYESGPELQARRILAALLA